MGNGRGRRRELSHHQSHSQSLTESNKPFCDKWHRKHVFVSGGETRPAQSVMTQHVDYTKSFTAVLQNQQKSGDYSKVNHFFKPDADSMTHCKNILLLRTVVHLLCQFHVM